MAFRLHRDLMPDYSRFERIVDSDDDELSDEDEQLKQQEKARQLRQVEESRTRLRQATDSEESQRMLAKMPPGATREALERQLKGFEKAQASLAELSAKPQDSNATERAEKT